MSKKAHFLLEVEMRYEIWIDLEGASPEQAEEVFESLDTWLFDLKYPYPFTTLITLITKDDSDNSTAA